MGEPASTSTAGSLKRSQSLWLVTLTSPRARSCYKILTFRLEKSHRRNLCKSLRPVHLLATKQHEKHLKKKKKRIQEPQASHAGNCPENSSPRQTFSLFFGFLTRGSLLKFPNSVCKEGGSHRRRKSHEVIFKEKYSGGGS